MKKISIFAFFLVMLMLPCGAQQIQSQWAGKRVAFLGDSITDAGQINSTNNVYWRNLQDILGITPFVYGISGHQMCHIPGQTDKLLDEHGQGVDAIIVFAGTNDFNAGVPLGEWYSYDTQEADYNGQKLCTPHRTMLFDGSTFRGRINIAMRHLKSNYPDKQIILLTPVHRGFAQFGPNNIQPDETHSNRIGLFIDEYVDVIKETADIWSVPVIDINSISGFYPLMDEHADYFRNSKRDRLHPNTSGQLRLAYVLAYQLLAYPAGFPKYVALTFDDGPSPDTTPQILDLLEQYGIPGTFFIIGDKVDKHTAKVMQRAYSMGCEIENHSWTHPKLEELSEDEIKSEIEKTSTVIEKYIGEAPRFLRPPYLSWNEKVSAATDLTFIAGSCPEDWNAGQSVQNRIDGVLDNVEDRLVILLHDFSGNSQTVEALKTIIPELLDRGYTFVTVSDLFDLRYPDGCTWEHDHIYHCIR